MRPLVITQNMTVDGAVEKYVVSSTMTDPAWQRSTILTGDPLPTGHRTPLTLLEHRAVSSGVTYTRWTPRKD